MGVQAFDQYTYLHFSSGISAYFWNIHLINWIILHTIFEILENSKQGIKLIDNYIKIWPGGKKNKDSFINIIGDTIGAIVGWLSAYFIDKLGEKYGWYKSHL
jgi:hypothetical protein